MKKLFQATYALFICSTATAQLTFVEDWQARFASADSIATFNSAVDANGNIYVTATTVSLTTDLDIVVIKYNTNGDTIWVRTFNGTANGSDQSGSLVLDTDCNVYVTGTTETASAGNDMVIFKYDSSGVLQWISTFNLSGTGNDIGVDIGIDASRNLYVAGFSQSNIMVVKFNSSGTQQWAVTDRAGELNAISVAGNGNVYVAGRTPLPNSDFITIKYNSAGIEQWFRTFSGSAVSGFDRAVAVKINSSQDVYVTGTTMEVGSGEDITTIKYNTNGVLQWAQGFDGPDSQDDLAFDMALDGAGNAYVTGASNGLITALDIVTIKYSSSGILQWLKRFDGGFNAFDFATSIGIDEVLNSVYVSGSSSNGGNSDMVLISYRASSGVDQWRAFLDGGDEDCGEDLVVDSKGNVYVTGNTFDIPTSVLFLTTLKYTAIPEDFDVGALHTDGMNSLNDAPGFPGFVLDNDTPRVQSEIDKWAKDVLKVSFDSSQTRQICDAFADIVDLSHLADTLFEIGQISKEERNMLRTISNIIQSNPDTLYGDRFEKQLHGVEISVMNRRNLSDKGRAMLLGTIDIIRSSAQFSDNALTNIANPWHPIIEEHTVIARGGGRRGRFIARDAIGFVVGFSIGFLQCGDVLSNPLAISCGLRGGAHLAVIFSVLLSFI